MNRDELYHYGVPGMKWRRHKYISKAGKQYVYSLRDAGKALTAKNGRASNYYLHRAGRRFRRAERITDRAHLRRKNARALRRDIGRGLGEANYLRAKAKYVGRSKVDPQLRKGYYTAKNGATSAYKKLRNTAVDTYDTMHKKSKKKVRKVRNYAEGYQRMRQNKKRAANY